jgi:L-iditol 2-dehydrogenase
MKALVYTDVKTLTYRDEPMPVPAEGQALVKIMASGICGSDMHAFLGHDKIRRPPPLIMGHEAAGIVVGGAQDGRRVTINPLVGCGACSACDAGRENICPDRKLMSIPPAAGAFAEYAIISEENLVTVPDDVPFEHAALAEPLACGWHAVRLGDAVLDTDIKDARCLVIGGGAIGVGSALALKAFGATDITVTEPNTLRRDALADIDGFTAVEAADGLYDLVIDAVGYAVTRADATAFVRPGGVIAHIGLGEAEGGLDVRRMTLQEITFIGTYTYTPKDFKETAQAIFDGRFGSLDWITKRPLGVGQQAFDDIRGGVVAAPKIILIPDHKE